MEIFSSSLLLFLSCAVHLVTLTASQSQPNFLRYFCFSSKGNCEANTTYTANLEDDISSALYNSEISHGFYNFSVGQNSDDRLNVIAFCRGDVKPNVCHSCLNGSVSKLMNLCCNFHQQEAIAYYDKCMLSFSNRTIFQTVRVTPRFGLPSPQNVTLSLSNQFNQALMILLNSLRSEAASGGSLRKFATGKTSLSQNTTIYALVQCTPDLSEQDCSNCLGTIIGRIQYCCMGKEGTRIYAPSCGLRFEHNSFYDPSVHDVTVWSPPLTPSNNSTPLSPPPSFSGNDDNMSRTVIIVVVPATAFLILIISICIIFRLKNFKKKITETIRHDEPLQFNIGAIRAATDNFSEDRKIGQGGFGVVYKGTLPDRQEVAVKRLFKNSKHGDGEVKFKNEVTLVARLQHRNLVKLLGFCLEREERILIYEFLPNSSLDHFIFDPIKRKNLDWERRCRIIEGITRGLLYLHEDSRLKIIHRDLKTSNILLDSKMNPKISDFDTVRLFEMDQTHVITKKVVGTPGFMAPECMVHSHFSVKSDIFSFGIILLEIVSGKKRSCYDTEDEIECLLTHAWKKWNEGTASTLIDPALMEGSRNEMMKCMHIGLLCVQESISDRPTIASVIHMLNSNSVTLPAPEKPGFFMQGSVVIPEPSSSSSLEHNSGSTEPDGRRIATAPL